MARVEQRCPHGVPRSELCWDCEREERIWARIRAELEPGIRGGGPGGRAGRPRSPAARPLAWSAYLAFWAAAWAYLGWQVARWLWGLWR
ncbi:MAG TPA: hypothetical protein VNO79_05985 [Actinomycetota bacterium]|nr:hypothetical protein [Actinomycetota bacterium]